MKISKIESGFLFDTVQLQANQRNAAVEIKTYGPLLAKIVSILRNIGWMITAGYCCKENLIQIPYGKQNHYLYPSDINLCLQQLGETLPAEISEINQVTIGLIVTNLRGFKTLGQGIPVPNIGLPEGPAIPKPAEKNLKIYDYSKVEKLTQKNVQLLDEFKAKGINFHFTTTVQILIYKDVLFDLPEGDYIVMYTATPRINTFANECGAVELMKRIPRPFVLDFCGGVNVHHSTNVREIEFKDDNDVPIGKECYVVPLLYNRNNNIKVQTFNKQKIDEFRNQIN